MSRIGKKPISITSGVKVTLDGQNVKVEGPKGRLERTIHEQIEVKMEADQLLISSRVGQPGAALQGLSRSLISNMVDGVTNGFTKVLEINGVGYRAELKGSNLNLSLGYSHPIELDPPEGVSVSVEENIITVSGINKQDVGDFAAKLRSLRKPEPYKGKGVRYVGEYVPRKEGKKVAAAS